jgi:hypothetical protein
MSATPQSIGATLRGKAAVDEVRDLLSQLAKVDEDLDSFGGMTESNTYGPFNVTHDELHQVIQRRRDALLNKLQNKGIRIAPDPEITHHDDAKASA